MISKIKKIKTKNYIVIGTAHLGMQKNVLSAIANIAENYNAQVIHTGPLCNVDEINMWRRRKHKIRVWSNGDKIKNQQKIEYLEQQANDLILYSECEYEEDYEKIEKKAKKLTENAKLLSERLSNNEKRLLSEIEELEHIQESRISTLIEFFPNIKFVCNDELCIPDHARKFLGKRFINENLLISPYLSITSVPANGDKVSGSPITTRTYNTLRDMGLSHIIAHMTPQTHSFQKSGLNEAFNYITTGALQITQNPKKITESFLSSAKASCILVSIDEKTGEFHTQRLRVKMLWSEKRNLIPHILHDGIVVDSSGGFIEVESKDKASHITDSHAPFEHMGVLAVIRALIELHRPSTHVDGGDTGDFSSVSRHTEGYPGYQENERLVNDLYSVFRYLKACVNDEEFPWVEEKVLLDSNHAEWISAKVAKHPWLKDLIDWPTLSKTIFKDWNVFIREAGSDKSFKFGDLSIRHADREQSITKAYQIYRNYLGGHHHSFYEYIDAIFVGPGCKLGPAYLSNSVTSWQNQATTITRYKNKTCKHPKIVLHCDETEVSRFAYRGQIYQVPFYKYDDNKDFKKIVTDALLNGALLLKS